MKNFYTIHFIDLRIQVDHITPRKVQLFDENRAAPVKARLFVIKKT